jgi:DNA-binding response OmpR family regulator
MTSTAVDQPAMNRRLLVVDDDKAFRQSLAERLRVIVSFDCREAETGRGALDIAAKERFDAVLLDIGLPDMDGRKVCRLLRRAGVSAPIIMLTAADTDVDTILGLDSGANDYITKPFRMGVLLARLRAQLRQHSQSKDAVFTIGPYTLRPAAKMLLDQTGKKMIHLTEKEAAVLKYLYRAGSRAIGRGTLLGEVWGYNAGVITHTLETHVYRLRQKIERNPAPAAILVTVA